MSFEIKINSDVAKLKIVVLDYENVKAKNISDKNWLNCTVNFEGLPFTAKVDASFTTHDFARFYDELTKALKSLEGTAHFSSDENILNFHLIFFRTGKVELEGTIESNSRLKGRLSFYFESNQSYFNEIISDLEQLLRHFPIKH